MDLYTKMLMWLSTFPEEFKQQMKDKLEKDSEELHQQIMNDALLIQTGHPMEQLFERLSEDLEEI